MRLPRGRQARRSPRACLPGGSRAQRHRQSHMPAARPTSTRSRPGGRPCAAGARTRLADLHKRRPQARQDLPQVLRLARARSASEPRGGPACVHAYAAARAAHPRARRRTCRACRRSMSPPSFRATNQPENAMPAARAGAVKRAETGPRCRPERRPWSRPACPTGRARRPARAGGERGWRAYFERACEHRDGPPRPVARVEGRVVLHLLRSGQCEVRAGLAVHTERTYRKEVSGYGICATARALVSLRDSVPRAGYAGTASCSMADSTRMRSACPAHLLRVRFRNARRRSPLPVWSAGLMLRPSARARAQRCTPPPLQENCSMAAVRSALE